LYFRELFIFQVLTAITITSLSCTFPEDTTNKVFVVFPLLILHEDS